MSIVTKEELKQCRDRVKPRLTDESQAQPATATRTKLEIKERHDEIDFQKELDKINKFFYSV